MARIPDEALRPLSEEMFLATRNRSVVPLNYNQGVAVEEGEFEEDADHEVQDQDRVMASFPDIDGPVV